MTVKTQKAIKATPQLDGVTIGVLVGLDKNHNPLVVFSASPDEKAVPARTTAQLKQDDIGKEVALLFEQGDVQRPLIIGPIQKPETAVAFRQDQQPVSLDLDDEHLVLNAKQSITLKCGKASITLTKSGKVLIRGAYLLNRSSGVNRIKGGSVQIN